MTEDDTELTKDYFVKQKPMPARFESHENFGFRPRFSTVTSDLSENSRIEKGFKGRRPFQEANCCQRLWFIWTIPVLRVSPFTVSSLILISSSLLKSLEN